MFSAEIIQWIRDGQRAFGDLVFNQLQSFAQGHPFAASFSLISAGFFYGVAHAIGPGHGKVIVSSYLLANRNSLKRGLLIIVMSSLLQAMTAIALVFGYYYALDATRSEAEHAARTLEIASFVLVGCIGLALAARGCADFWRLAHNALGGSHASLGPVAPCCHHAHLPSHGALDQSRGYASMVSIILSVGIRPCTGALMLLFFSCIAGLTVPGILAIFAMAVGTAATTGALALMVVQSRNLALRFVDKSEHTLQIMHAGLRLAGGVIIMLFAALFLLALSGSEDAAAAHTHPLYKSLR
ncbi:MAG: hypothetical protein ABTQ34_06590 [Bdellovibrionales bacterium]